MGPRGQLRMGKCTEINDSPTRLRYRALRPGATGFSHSCHRTAAASVHPGNGMSPRGVTDSRGGGPIDISFASAHAKETTIPSNLKAVWGVAMTAALLIGKAEGAQRRAHGRRH